MFGRILPLYLLAAAATVTAKLQKFDFTITEGTLNFDGKSSRYPDLSPNVPS